MNYMSAIQKDKERCLTIAMEECAELVQAISKAKRGQLDKANLSEEIADVLICIDWVKDIFDVTDKDIETWLDIKKHRVTTNIKGNMFY